MVVNQNECKRICEKGKIENVDDIERGYTSMSMEKARNGPNICRSRLNGVRKRWRMPLKGWKIAVKGCMLSLCEGFSCRTEWLSMEIFIRLYFDEWYTSGSLTGRRDIFLQEIYVWGKFELKKLSFLVVMRLCDVYIDVLSYVFELRLNMAKFEISAEL